MQQHELDNLKEIAMTHEELTDLQDIVNGKPWEARMKLAEYLQSVSVEKEDSQNEPPRRTSAQSRSMHLWFDQIAAAAQNEGVTMNLIISHTHDVMVTPEGVKGLWKALQVALYGKKSTTELRKTGEIDTLIDHMVALFAKVEIELPPFPHDDKKQRANMTGYKNAAGTDTMGVQYPDMDQSTTADKF